PLHRVGPLRARNELKSHFDMILCVIEHSRPLTDTGTPVFPLTTRRAVTVSQPEILNQAFELSFNYTRSVGPVVGRFLTELRDRKIVGIKASDGRVIVPPMEYDPDTAEELSEFVEVAQQGEIVSFAWVKEPREAHPLDKPFAWAMVKLDGADVPMVHCLAADSESAVTTGARVQVVWADETVGSISDIRHFELV
ncbi:MAG: putative OB-fold protein, partial [Halioglobus sp.]